MTVERSRARRGRFAATGLPWLVAAGAFLVYSGTLNHWISLASLQTVARTAGWMWQPQLQEPLSFLVLFPFRFVSETWVPLALNILAAGCAACVLLLLARSVALLPQDRTREQRWREESADSTLSIPLAWMPPLLAVLACGLQLTFWEAATSATGDMLNLLVFAGAIQCLLEFRINRHQVWLSGGAFLYAAGMTSDWTMIGCFPVFVAAVVWLKGLSFFDLRFLVRMALWGVAGLSLYLVLPMVQAFQPTLHLDFWEALKANLRSQRDALSGLPLGALLVLGLTSLLPLLILSIRWKSQTPHSGDDNPVTTFLTKAMFCLLHAGLLMLSLWIALDPPVSPRNLGLGAPLLTQYYLSALIIGYCSGYLLLVGSVPIRKLIRFQKSAGRHKLISKLTVAAIGLLVAAVPLALLWRNVGQIRITNGPALREFARQLYQGLPSGKSVVLSDDRIALLLLAAELGASRHDKDPLLLEMPSLTWGQYHILKAGQFKSRWPVPPPTNGLEVVEPARVLQLLSRFSSREQLVCLHPSFSYCLERFADRPNGGVHYLSPRARDALGHTADTRTATAGEQYWQARWDRTLRTLTGQAHRNTGEARPARGQLAGRLHLALERNLTALYLCAAYSRSLNDWGVRMQRAGRWREAGVWFQRALQLKPENLAARINSEFNARRQRGDSQRLDRKLIEQQYLDLFMSHRKWEEVITDDGPVDEPSFLLETARALLASGRPYQAIQEFVRCAELAPGWLEPKLWRAQSHLAVREFASASRLTDEIEAAGPLPDPSGIGQFLFCRATALQGLGRTNEATACIERCLAQYPDQPEVLAAASRLHLQNGRYQAALAVLDRLLDFEPRNPELLSDKGLAEMELAQYEAAVGTLTAAVSLAPSNQVVRLNRAIAQLRAGNLDAAQDDYQELLKGAPNSYKVLFGLGEIAWRRQDTNAAIMYYQQCLSQNTSASAEHRLVADRLRQLNGPVR